MEPIEKAFPKAHRVIIGIGHKARQGKDTAAACLQQEFGCTILHFADALYEECRKATILFKDTPPVIYFKTGEEDFFRYENPPETIVHWIQEKGIPKNGLPFEAQLFFGGMREKDGILLQFWGTEFRRKLFCWDYWVDKVRAVIESSPHIDFIIPDTRFKNEARMIKNMGGVIWKIDRIGYLAQDRNPNHASEIDLNDWDFDSVIVNDRTIPELEKKVKQLYLQLKGSYYDYRQNQ